MEKKSENQDNSIIIRESQGLYYRYQNAYYNEMQEKKDYQKLNDKITSINSTREILASEANRGYLNKVSNRKIQTAIKAINIFGQSFAETAVVQINTIDDAVKDTKAALWDAEQHYRDNTETYQLAARSLMEFDGIDFVEE